jgi:Ca2+-binding RTX toxin-like protein
MLSLTKSFMLAAVCAAALPAAASAAPNVDGTGIDLTYTSGSRAADVRSFLPGPDQDGTAVYDAAAIPTASGTCHVTKPHFVACPGVFNDVANLGAHDDIGKFAAQGAVTIHGGAGDDQEYAWGIGVTMTGDGGDDLLIGSADGTARVAGGIGADRIWAHGAGTIVTGDAGRDKIVIDSVQPGVDGGAGADTIAMSRSAAAGTVAGGDGSDLISAYPSTDRFATGGATYDGGAGNDTINVFGDGTSFGNDTVTCGDGNDTVYADPTDTVAADCEHVILAAPPAGSPVAALPALADQYDAGAAQLDPHTLGTGSINGF